LTNLINKDKKMLNLYLFNNYNLKDLKWL
jgi:hypothetical protein